jgi:hypothetical protein
VVEVCAIADPLPCGAVCHRWICGSFATSSVYPAAYGIPGLPDPATGRAKPNVQAFPAAKSR